MGRPFYFAANIMIAPLPTAFAQFNNATVTLELSRSRAVQGRKVDVPACVLLGDPGNEVSPGTSPARDSIQVFISRTPDVPQDLNPQQGMVVWHEGRRMVVNSVRTLPGTWTLDCSTRLV